MEDRQGTFSPFVTSVDGLIHIEEEDFLKHIATSIAAKWEKSYAETRAFVRARLLFALIRASSLCLRGSMVEWRSRLGFDDGPSIMQ